MLLDSKNKSPALFPFFLVSALRRHKPRQLYIVCRCGEEIELLSGGSGCWGIYPHVPCCNPLNSLYKACGGVFFIFLCNYQGLFTFSFFPVFFVDTNDTIKMIIYILQIIFYFPILYLFSNLSYIFL